MHPYALSWPVHPTCTNGQDFPFGVLGLVNSVPDLHKRSCIFFWQHLVTFKQHLRPFATPYRTRGVPFVINEDENAKYKKSSFLH